MVNDSRLNLVFICLGVILSACSCNIFEEEVYLKPMPVFASIDEAGAKVIDDHFHKGCSIIFLPCQDEHVNNGIAGRIEEFEKVEKIKFNKLAVKEEKSEFSSDSWQKIVDEKFRRKLEERYPGAFVLVFEDNKLLVGLTADLSPKLRVDLDYVRQGLYNNVLRIHSQQALFELRRPENYINPKALLRKVSDSGDVLETHCILIVESASYYCNKKNYLKIFQEKVADLKGISCEIVLAPTFSKMDLDSLTNNFDLFPSPKSFPKPLEGEISQFNKHFYGSPVNFVFIYEDKKFRNSISISNCEILDQLF